MGHRSHAKVDIFGFEMYKQVARSLSSSHASEGNAVPVAPIKLLASSSILS